MHTRKISSLQHPVIKHICKLEGKRSYRREQKSCFVLGKRLLETLHKKVPFKRIFTLEEQTTFKAEEQILITPQIFKKISGTPSPEPLGAEVLLPEEASLKGSFLLALDRISDPGNLGTLFRTAYAFGIDGIFLLHGCSDPFSDKAIRAAKGASFFLPFQEGSEEDLLELAKDYELLIADLEGKSAQPLKKPTILVLGNESHGPSPTLVKIGKRVTIPMKEGVESLNVAIAGAILLYEMRKP